MNTITFAQNTYTHLTCPIDSSDTKDKITVSNLGVKYHKMEALRNINFEVTKGRLIGIIGPNGAGKSTLIKAMLGLIPGTGKIIYNNEHLMLQREKVAYVPQRSQIDWTYPATVWDVVMMGRVKKTGWFNPFSKMSKEIAKDALNKVGILEYCHRPIGQLSGGQQQRVFIARSLTQQAEIFCFDEPFAGIDQKTEKVIFDIFTELAKNGKIVLVVNHDLGESITHFDDLILLNKDLIAFGDRVAVLTKSNLYHAYNGNVAFFSDQ